MSAIGLGEKKDEKKKPAKKVEPTRPSPGIFFWLVGPITLVILAMFAASPQCILDSRFSCSTNWAINQGTLHVWPLDVYWLRLARITLLVALVICLWSIIYHVYLAVIRETPFTPYVLMGLACTVLIPASLYLMVSKMFGQHDMTEIRPAIQTADSTTYRLYALAAGLRSSLLLAKDSSTHLLATTGEILGSVTTTGAALQSSVVVLSPKCALAIRPNSLDPVLCEGGDGRWIVAILPPNQLVLALDRDNRQFLSGPLIEALSPFLLVGNHEDISPEQRHNILELTNIPNERGEKLPGIDALWTAVSHPNANARMLLADMLSKFKTDRREAYSILQRLAYSDEDSRVRERALSVINNYYQDVTGAQNANNLLDLSLSDRPATLLE